MELERKFKLLDHYAGALYQWENGFRAILLQNPISPAVAYLTYYTVGSAQETPRQRGLAHFFEHMMFRETANLADGEFDRIMSEIGGVGLNAYTSYDGTVFHVNVPTAHLERVIALEAERMRALKLSPDLIEQERGAVLGEMRMYQDMPSEQLWDALMAGAFAISPYRHPVIGYEASVSEFSQQDFANFYQAHYAPNRAVVVVAGGFDHDQVLNLLDAAYGPLERGSPAPPSATPEKPWEAEQTLEVSHPKVTSTTVLSASQCPELTHPDSPALVLLGAVLGAGRSSPLYQDLVQSGLATHASVSNLSLEIPLAAPGLFLCDMALQQGVTASRALAAWERLLEETARGISDGAWERARNQLKLGFYNGHRGNLGLARQIAGFTALTGNPCLGEEFMQQILSTTASQVRAALRRYILAAPRTVAIQHPGQEQAA